LAFPAFDPDWSVHGYMSEAVALFEGWARAKLPSLPRATLEIVRLPGRTPVIVIDIPGEGKDPVLLYGHLDKQPEMARTPLQRGHGPNEFLHIPTARRIALVIAQILADHGARSGRV
jgi:acetylornithine deacetylase/succinyl-diaminopimelate desuccinylase-like protein